MLCWWASFWSLVLPLFLLLLRVMFQMKALDAVLPFVLFVCPLLSFLMWGGTVFLFGVDAVAGGSKRRRDRWRKQLAAIVSARTAWHRADWRRCWKTTMLSRCCCSVFSASIRCRTRCRSTVRRDAICSRRRRKCRCWPAPWCAPWARDAITNYLSCWPICWNWRRTPSIRFCAVRVALGRHHQVVLICPWPPGLELPPATRSIADVRSHAERGNEKQIWDQVTTRRFHLAYQRLRYTFTRMGVAVLCAAGDEPVSLILRRLERLRNLGRPHS